MTDFVNSLAARVLADEFEVSRDTVQRSIQMLADEGKVTRWPGLGWYVCEAGNTG